MGIEPTSEAWEASILPLYDARSLGKAPLICSITFGSRAAQEAGKFFCDSDRGRALEIKIEAAEFQRNPRFRGTRLR